jgi:hypothetical protein
MSQEIVYTSAPQGLKTGSKGFCTVVSTEAITDYFAERLEMLSGYRHAFSPGDSRAPVNYSHLQIKVGRHNYHVLSRVCDAGFDYSQRSNKLAHHVALEASELVPAGPAAVLASRGFCVTRWDGATKMLPQGRLPTAQRAGTGTCPTWKALAGDPGWAGILAESAMVQRPRPVSVIFRAGTDTLSLVVEAMCLLPAQKRWSVSFNTYYTKAVAGSDCLWRFVLDGTKQAEALRANPHEVIIDLTQRPGPATGGHLVDLARSGKNESDSSQAFVLPGGTEKSWPTRSPRPQAIAAADETAQNDDNYDPYMGIPELPESHRRKKKKLSRVHIGLMVGAGLMVAAAGALLAGAWFSGRLSPPRNSQLQPTLRQADETRVPDVDEAGSDEVQDEAVPADSSTSSVQTASPVSSAANSDGRGKGLPVLELPAANETARIAFAVEDPRQCELSLLGSRLFFRDQVTLKQGVGTAESPASWSVESLNRSDGTPDVIGTFQLDGEQLWFTRGADAPDTLCTQLTHCVLKINDQQRQHYLALAPTYRVASQPFRFDDGKAIITLGYQLPEFVQGRISRLMQFDLQLSAENGAETASGGLRVPDSALAGLTANSTVRLTIHDDLNVAATRLIRPSRLGASRGIAQTADRDLAQLDIVVSIAEGSGDGSSPLVEVQVTPTVFLRLIDESFPNFARRFLQGDETLIADVSNAPYSMNALTDRLSPGAIRKRIIEPAIEEYNRVVDSPDKRVSVSDGTLQLLRDGIDDYYRKQSVADSRKAKQTLDRLIEIVNRKSEKLSRLTNLTKEINASRLDVTGYLMLDGQIVTVMTTKATR